MEELIQRIHAGFTEFGRDAEAQAANGNKAAGARARKKSLELERLLKEFRAESLKASKA